MNDPGHKEFYHIVDNTDGEITITEVDSEEKAEQKSKSSNEMFEGYGKKQYATVISNFPREPF